MGVTVLMNFELLVGLTVSETEKASAGLFGFSLDAWEGIIIAIVSVLIGGIITYFSQIGLRKREEKIRVIGLLTEKRISAYEKIIDALDVWGGVTYNTSKKQIKRVEELTQDTFTSNMLMYPVILTDRKTLYDFNALWQETIRDTHLNVDKNVTKRCRLVSWYLSVLMETFDVQFLDIRDKKNKLDYAIKTTMTELGCIIFDDYYMLANPIYQGVTEYLQSPKLIIEKESLRNIQRDQITEFIVKAPEMKLFKYRLVLRRRILELLGYDIEQADELLKNDPYDLSELTYIEN